MITIFLFTVAITSLAILYYKHMRGFDHWKDRGVFYLKPKPFFGNAYEVATFSKTSGEGFKLMYDQVGDRPYFGFFLMDQPILMIKSPKLIKKILVKDFNVFRDRTTSTAKHSDIFRNFLFFASSARWKYLRNQLSPLFTSEKLKGMTDKINKTGDRLMEQIAKSSGPLDTKEIYTNFITEAIAKCFFSIDAKCLDDEKSIFREILRRLFHPSMKTLFIQFLYFVRAGWVDIFKLDFVDSGAVKFLVQVFQEVIELRKEPNGKVTDIIDVMIQNKNKGGAEFGKIGHMASGVQFMVAGIETTSTGLSWIMFELSVNKDIQERLREEIVRVVRRHNGQITWQGVQEMKYLNMCYLETLRRYPLLPILDRRAAEDYKIEETGYIIEKGTHIFIPLFALSMDEKYYPEPNKFNPERFADSPHGHANDDGLVYIPFGAGQRICLGERFAIISTKLVIVKTLLNYQLDTCEESPPYPVEFNPKTTFLESKNGLAVKFTPLDIVL